VRASGALFRVFFFRVSEEDPDMFELLRKSILAGIGAAVLTAEKVQEATKRFVDEGKLSAEEAEKFANDLLRSGERQWDDMSSRISEGVRKGVETLDFVNRKDFQDLKARVEMLEQRLSILEEMERRAVETSADQEA
jgi:polyhydroxyalkanoate synthesis regulator phasin